MNILNSLSPEEKRNSLYLILGIAVFVFFDYSIAHFFHNINHQTKSVTVVSQNATDADGWATALLVMGRKKGIKLAEDTKKAVLFIEDVDGKLLKFKSSEFKKLVKE